MKKLIALLVLLTVCYAVHKVYGQARGGVTTSGGGRINTTNLPGNDSTPMYLRALTNADGTLTYYWSIVVAANTNSQPPNAWLTNLTVTGTYTNANLNQFTTNTFTLTIKSGVLLTNSTHEGILTNNGTLWQVGLARFLGVVTNVSPVNNLEAVTNYLTTRLKGITTVEANIVASASNLISLAGNTLPLSNAYTRGLTLVGNNAQPPPDSGSIKLVFTNGAVWSLKSDGTMADLEAQAAGGSGIPTSLGAGTNTTIKGMTNNDYIYFNGKIVYKVETIGNTIVDFDTNKEPVKYLLLSGNTTVTLSNLIVGGGGTLIVSNPASHTFSISGAATYDNQNTTPPITTNGYTVYEIFRPLDGWTNINTRGRELELTAGVNNNLSTNATGTQLSIVGMFTIATNGTIVGIKTNLNIIYGTNMVIVATNEANQVTLHISSGLSGGGGESTTVNANQFTLDGTTINIKNNAALTNFINWGWTDNVLGVTNRSWVVTSGDVTNNGAVRHTSTTTIHGLLTITNLINGGWTDNVLQVTNRSWVFTVGNITNQGTAQLLSTVTIHGLTTATNILNGGWLDNILGVTNRSWVFTTGHSTNRADMYINTVNMLAGVVTNNITFLTANMNPTGNGTNFETDFTFGWRTFLMTNHFHLTGCVNVAAADLGKPWIVVGRNRSGSTFKASVDAGFKRSGTNFVNVADGQKFQIMITPDGSGLTNPTNFAAQIILHDSP